MVRLRRHLQGGAHLVPYLLHPAAGLAVGGSAEFQQFAFDQLYDVVKRNLLRGTGEHIAALFAPPTGDEPAIAKLAQNLHQVVRRNPLDFGQFLDMRESFLAMVSSKLSEHPAGIINLD